MPCHARRGSHASKLPADFVVADARRQYRPEPLARVLAAHRHGQRRLRDAWATRLGLSLAVAASIGRPPRPRAAPLLADSA